MYIVNGTVCRPDDPRPHWACLLRCMIIPEIQVREPSKTRRIPERVKNLIYHEIHSGKFSIYEVATRNQVNKNTVIKIRDTWEVTEIN